MNQVTRFAAIAMVLCMPSASDAVSYTKVVDTSSTLPGRSTPFNVPFQNASIATGGLLLQLAQIAQASDREIYRWDQGTFTKIADATTTSSQGTSLFSIVGAPSIDENGNVAWYSSSGRLNLWINGVIYSHPFVGSTQGYALPEFRNGVAYVTSSGWLLRADATTTQVLFTPGTPAPGGGTLGQFDQFFAPHVDYRNGTMSFMASSGMYTSSSLTLSKVSSSNITYPVSWDHGMVFNGSNKVWAQDSGGQLFQVAPSLSPQLGEPPPITSFNDVSSNGPFIAFTGTNEQHIHAWNGARMFKVLSVGDVVLGKTVTTLTMSPQSMDGDKLLFWADGAWYLAGDIAPAPTAAQDWNLLQ